MSRSKRKSPFIGITCARTDKPAKVADSKRVRRNARQTVKLLREPPDRRELTDPWSHPKDGKRMIEPLSKWMRK